MEKKINRLRNIFVRKQNVAMLHMGRCGSTVVARMLDAHSEVFWAGEIFVGHMDRESVKHHGKKLVKRTYWDNSSKTTGPVFGFETKFLPFQHLSPHCIGMQLEDYLSYLEELGVTDFIILERKNLLRQLISEEIGEKKGGVWRSTEDAKAPTKIKVTGRNNDDYPERLHKPESLVERFGIAEAAYERAHQILENKHLLSLVYEEDILNGPSVAYDKVCSFLGLENERPEITLKRMNPFSLRDMVVDLEEVQAALTGTKYEWMLQDD